MLRSCARYAARAHDVGDAAKHSGLLASPALLKVQLRLNRLRLCLTTSHIRLFDLLHSGLLPIVRRDHKYQQESLHVDFSLCRLPNESSGSTYVLPHNLLSNHALCGCESLAVLLTASLECVEQRETECISPQRRPYDPSGRARNHETKRGYIEARSEPQTKGNPRHSIAEVLASYTP